MSLWPESLGIANAGLSGAVRLESHDDHDPLAIVAIRPGAGQRAAEHERDRETQVESREGQGEFGFLLCSWIQDLREVRSAQTPSCRCR